jgi:hypothetical protein
MRLGKQKVVLFVAFIVALFSLLIVPPYLHTIPDLELPIKKAIGFLELSNEPHALLWLDVIYRRFQIEEFADSLQRYDHILNELPGEQLQLNVFRRIVDYDNPIQQRDLERFAGLDRLVVPALYCDRFGISDDYAELLENNVSFGEYELTHVLLAVIWMQDNGCELPLSDSSIRNIYRANAALINNDSVVDDLELEAAAFLYLAGQGGLVQDFFIERVIAAQNGDGGWNISGDDKEDSGWHPTVLGLLLLLHVEFPLNSYPPILSPLSP